MVRDLNKFEATALFLGDLIVLYVSLWLTLFIRRFAVPSTEVWVKHVVPFSILFAFWVLIFFIAGLYEKHTTILKSRIQDVIFNAQIANSVLAIIFFYLIPYFGITPKTTLFIYLVISFGLVFLWRRYVVVAIGARKQQPAILIGSGEEMHELMKEVNENPRYGIHFTSSIDLDEIESIDFEKDIIDRIYSEKITTAVVDTKNERIAPILPRLYNLIFSKLRFIDMYRVYEDIFDRVPLSLVGYSWFLENISSTRKFTYSFLKRIMDIVISLPLFFISLLIYPVVLIGIKVQDGGPIFHVQERVGRNNRNIKMAKFRTMTGTDTGKDVLNSKHEVTPFGKFMRKTRIDELPQLWNVLKGDMSLIGPRPEFPAMVEAYHKEIPYYNVRHLIKPGLSGWAQIYHDEHPHHRVGVSETKTKLSYDLYYIKNRSFLLDLKIALKTIKKIVSRAGI